MKSWQEKKRQGKNKKERKVEKEMLYPIMTKSRLLMDLSGIWNFRLDKGNGFEEKWQEKPLSDALLMPVPSSYNDLTEDMEFREHYGWVFYQRSVPLHKKSVEGQRVLLRVEAATHAAKVYWNGVQIAEHKGGFLPFEVEIEEELQKEENLLTIAVDNRIDYTTLPVGGTKDMLGGMFSLSEEEAGKKRNHPNFDFFNYCGLTRPVKLYTTPKDYIADITVVPSVQGNRAELSYEVDAVGNGKVHVEVLDEEGVCQAACDGAGGRILIENAYLWEPLKPYLYQIKVSFGEDEYTLPYGIRTVRVEGTRFLINEKPFYFKGYGKHEDTFPAGRGLNMPMNAKDMSLMKWQGANSFRTSHYPYSEEMMRLCDAEGIVVIDETTAVGVNLTFGGGANFGGEQVKTFDKEHGVQTAEHHAQVIKDLIKRDKNYACVVMWSIANEPDSAAEGAYEYFAPLYELARKEDPQKRPCTLVSVQMPQPQKDVSAALSDVICLNRYYGWYIHGGELESAERALRKEMQFWETVNKPVMFTEYGADTVAGFHDTFPLMYTEEYQQEYYEMNHRVFDGLDFFVGEQVWNFADFATSQSLLRVGGNRKGLFTRDRKPKMAAHYFRNRWKSIPDFGYKN